MQSLIFPRARSVEITPLCAPWGKVYFLLESPRFEVAWPGGQSALTQTINDRREHKHPPTYPIRNGSHKRDFAWCLAAVVFAAALFLFVNSQVRIPIPLDPKEFPHLAIYSQVQEVMLRWPWNVGVVTVLVGLIVALKFDKRTVPLSLTLGALLGTLASRVLL